MTFAVEDTSPAGPGWLHWLSAALIAALLAIGWLVFEKAASDYPVRTGLLAAHMAGGSLIGLLTVVRVAIRLRRKPRRRGSGEIVTSGSARPSIQRLLYVAIFAMVGTGFATAITSGLNLAVFGGDTSQLVADWPQLTVLQVHGWLALLLLALVAVHVSVQVRDRRASLTQL